MNINKINKLAEFFVKALEKPVDEWLKCLSPNCRVRENQYHEKPYFCYECAKKRKEQGLPEQPEPDKETDNISDYDYLFINQLNPTKANGLFRSETKIGNKTYITIIASTSTSHRNHYEKELNNCDNINLRITTSEGIINNIIEGVQGDYDFGKKWGKYFEKDNKGQVMIIADIIFLRFPSPSQNLITYFLDDLKELTTL